MNKKYIAPQMEVTTLSILSVICTSGGEQGDIQISEKTTEQVWAPTRGAGLAPVSFEGNNCLEH